MSDHSYDLKLGKRFDFGANWHHFLPMVNEDRVRLAEESLRRMLEVDNLLNKTFLDIGSGSGLFSLAARRIGAQVHSFDYDPQSVACTLELKRRYLQNDLGWIIEEGSVLDDEYLNRLGEFDVVYSWGVLHHTGAMWQALDKVFPHVAKGGKLFVALYNDQGRPSRWWLRVKQAYNTSPKALRWLILLAAFVRLWLPTTVRDILRGKPFQSWRGYAKRGQRGMNPWHDVVDWVGGLPFEVTKPEKVLDFFRPRGSQLNKLKTCAGGHGCNEYVFTRMNADRQLV